MVRAKEVRKGDKSTQTMNTRNEMLTIKAAVPRIGTHKVERAAWRDMHRRCLNPKNKAYSNYGGRGITVCARWSSFEAFFADMGPKPSPEHSLDRIDNDGNYTPKNCRWATLLEQAQNRREQKRSLEAQSKCLAFIKDYFAETLQSPSYAQMADHLGTSKGRVHKIVALLERRGAVRRRALRHRSLSILPPEGGFTDIDVSFQPFRMPHGTCPDPIIGQPAKGDRPWPQTKA
jgi:hypothetical protein